MLNKTNVLYIARQANDLLNGSKRNVSRSLRRLLSQVLDTPPGTKPLLIQSFAYDEGHNATQLRGIELFATDLAVELQSYVPTDLVKPIGIIREDEFGMVQNSYQLTIHVWSASLRELQELVKFVMELAYSMLPFADNPSVAACLEDYQYRGLPCNIAEDDDLWCISGHDKRTGGGGVLEWCYDEVDARFTLESMQRYPERFIGLKAAPWNQTVVSVRQPVAA